MNKIFKIFILIILSVLTLNSLSLASEEKIKIGLLIPITGNDKELGQQIIKSSRMALKDIGTENIEIYIKDTNSNPNTTIKSAMEFKEMGIKIVIGPVFYKSLIYLDEVKDMIFLSLTNKTLDLPNNIISAGINATSDRKSVV